MTTVAEKKTPVQANWSAPKTQNEVARAFAVHCMATMNVLGKYGDQAMKEHRDLVQQAEAEYLKSRGVKTPLDLVKAKAEFEANAFGSKIEIGGDENHAQLIYNQCAMWEAMQKHGKMTPEQKEQMLPHFETCVASFAKRFGFRGEVKMEGEKAVLTFSK